MTAGEVAEVFRVEAATVVKWLSDGHLPGFQIGPKRTWRVWRDEIREYLEANRNTGSIARTSPLT
ncbi:helix-turn-helix domain-containing protein [Streptomyces puniciscabiei]|uniref:helix-turn-helix domain-containing protein n=1 Tax=Streptomyces puniciscabiei TaxID=164348 RepID=UPI0033239F12